VKKFEILEHKADLKIRVFGKTKEELFEKAMVGMFAAAEYQPKVEGKEKRIKVKISSLDLPSLLVDFLNEILYLTETKKLVFKKVKFKKFSEREIEGDLTGKPLKRIGVHIKGATYHDLEIRQNKMFEATILFDV